MKEVFKSQSQQVEAREKINGAEAYGLFMDMGTGKSKVVIDEFCDLYEQGEITTVVIIAPNGVYLNWKSQELPKHINAEEIDYGVFEYESKKKGKAKEKELVDLFDTDKLKIFIINIESSHRERPLKYMKMIFDTEDVYLVIDESQKIKNHKAKCTKACTHLGTLAKYRRILTGTPQPNSPMDYYSQLNFLQPGIAGKSFFFFEAKYAIIKQMVMGTRSFKKIVGFKNKEELQQLVDSISYRITKEECNDLPPKTYMEHLVEATPEQIKAYIQMKEQKVMELESIEGDNKIFASTALTAACKLHQILCGHVRNEEGRVTVIKNKRGAELVEILESITGQVIIWHCYIGDLLVILPELEKANMSYVLHNGQVSKEDRQESIKLFREGHAKYFIATPATAGTGITLTNSNYQVYYSNSYNLGDRMQSEDRQHRIGQENPVTIIDMMIPKSVDTKIVKALRDKKSIADSILDDWRDIIGRD